MRLRAPAVLSVCALTACGGGEEARSAAEVARCFEAGGASVELNPRPVKDTASEKLTPVLTPDTKVVARGTLRAGKGTFPRQFLLFESTEAAADDAETRGRELARLFGTADDVVRRDTVLLVVLDPVKDPDRELVSDCL